MFHGDIEVGYLLGIDTGGWAKANIGMTAGLEAGIEVKARLTNNPGWEADAYLDANLNLEGNLLGGWKLDHNLSNTRLKAWRIADGLIDQDTPDGGTYKHGEDSGAARRPRARLRQSMLATSNRVRSNRTPRSLAGAATALAN